MCVIVLPRLALPGPLTTTLLTITSKPNCSKFLPPHTINIPHNVSMNHLVWQWTLSTLDLFQISSKDLIGNLAECDIWAFRVGHLWMPHILLVFLSSVPKNIKSEVALPFYLLPETGSTPTSIWKGMVIWYLLFVGQLDLKKVK